MIRQRAKHYRGYSASDLTSAAWLAGAGKTAEDIAGALGKGMTATKVYDLCNRHAIPLQPKAKNKHFVLIPISRDTYAEALTHAERYGIDPQVLLARLLDEVVVERSVIVRMLDRCAKIYDWIKEAKAENAPAPGDLFGERQARGNDEIGDQSNS